MQFRKTTMVLAAGLLWAFCLPGEAVSGGPARMGRMADMDGDGNMDIAVQQVTVTPIRAHVGDMIRIDVVIRNKGDGSRTIPAKVYANGKLIGSQLFTFGFSPGPADTNTRLTFSWNTSGVKPGEYKIQGEALLWGDTSPFDNSLEVKLPLLIAAPGAPFPDGEVAGGSATEGDLRAGKVELGGKKPAE